jgi:predicted transcriptional regulator
MRAIRAAGCSSTSWCAATATRPAPAELDVIIGSVSGSLAEIGKPSQAVTAEPVLAVPMRRSVRK